jgi:hypothetical protein
VVDPAVAVGGEFVVAANMASQSRSFGFSPNIALGTQRMYFISVFREEFTCNCILRF